MKINIRLIIAITGFILISTLSTARASQSNPIDRITSTDIASANPLNHWGTDQVYTPGSAGSHVSLAIDPDHNQAAWISFYNQTTSSLWVTHYVGVDGGNCGPVNTWYCEELHNQNATLNGVYSSIDIFPDINPDPSISTWKVGVAFYDETFHSLRYSVYTCPERFVCTWTTYTVDNTESGLYESGQYPSIKFDSAGIPHIAYHSRNNYMHFLMHAYYLGNSSGNCGDGSNWQCDPINYTSTAIGEYPSLDIGVDGTIYIAYYDRTHGRLEYAFSGSGGTCGAGNWFCKIVDNTGSADLGLYPSMHAPQDSTDVLSVAYYDLTNGKLKYATYLGAGLGNCGMFTDWVCSTIDDMGADLTWASISLKEDHNHLPMIAYTQRSEDLAPLSLRLAVPAEGESYANCGDPVSPDWFCSTLDNGGAYHDDAQFLSMAIKPNGLAAIAYSEFDSYEVPNNFNLLFTQQESWNFLPLTQK